MARNENKIIQQDETEWIDRQKHNLILRKYRLNTQRLIKEYEKKIQQQNRKIELLLKEVKRQKFIIDTFSNGNNETAYDETLPQNTNGYGQNDITSDTEPEAILHPHSETQGFIQNTKEKQEQKNKRTKIKRNVLDRIRNERKKTSLVSIEIQPQFERNIQSLTNVYICDDCNKTMSSRRVLAVCIQLISTLFKMFHCLPISQQKHKRMVHCLQKEFVCDHCSKAFCVRDGLKRHLRIHTGKIAQISVIAFNSIKHLERFR